MTSYSEEIVELNEEALLADGFGDALIGYVTIANKVVAAYDREKCIDILVKRDKMEPEEAEEYFEFNVVGSYMGENTPAFLSRFKK